jgi:hypothetical protein
MNTSGAEQEVDAPGVVTIDRSRYTAVVKLLSGRPSPVIPIAATVIGAGIVTFYMRSLGFSQTAAFVVGILCGGSTGMVIDLVRIRLRMGKALELLQPIQHDG